MAILGWFSPFANFVLPLLGVREVYNVPHLPFPIGMLVTLAAFGTWFAVVWSERRHGCEAQARDRTGGWVRVLRRSAS